MAEGLWRSLRRCRGLRELVAIVTAENDGRLPVDAKASLLALAAQLQACQTRNVRQMLHCARKAASVRSHTEIRADACSGLA
jgi:hypothetical protein